MVMARREPSADNQLPIKFRIRVKLAGLKPEQVIWDPVRRCIGETLVRIVLTTVWNRLGPRTLMELKKLVAPRLDGDAWCDLLRAEVIDKTTLWEEIRAGLIHSVTVDLDHGYQSKIWPHLQRTIAAALTSSQPSEIYCNASIEPFLHVEMELSPFTVKFGGNMVRSDRQLIVGFQHAIHWVSPLEVCVCLGDK